LGAPGYEEVEDGINFFFLGENPSLDNSLTGDVLNGGRNIGFTKVSKDLSEKLSDGPVEEGGFYGFNGNWWDLKNEGI